jgi:hypothetical protein
MLDAVGEVGAMDETNEAGAFRLEAEGEDLKVD